MEKNQPKGNSCTVGIKHERAEPSKPFGNGYGATGYGDWPAGF